MFELGWTEMLLIGIVALVVVGPQELPGLFRTIGQYVGKARGMARDFTRAMEAAADESGVRDIEKTIRAAANPVKFGTTSLRDAALGRTPAAPAKPLDPGTPLTPAATAGSAGPATDAMARQAAENRLALQTASAERRIAEAERRALEAERRALEAEKRAAAIQPTVTPQQTDETA